MKRGNGLTQLVRMSSSSTDEQAPRRDYGTPGFTRKYIGNSTYNRGGQRWKEHMELRAGQKLYSAVCTTAIIVVRAPSTEVEVAAGDQPMVFVSPVDLPGSDAEGAESGTLIGKRYTDVESGLEVLCTKSGASPITADGRRLTQLGAKALPSSD
jgi:hypothetical protein